MTRYASTVSEARSLARQAKICRVRCPISADDAVYVDASKAAVMRALADLNADAPCGGSLDDGVFALDTVF